MLLGEYAIISLMIIQISNRQLHLTLLSLDIQQFFFLKLWIVWRYNLQIVQVFLLISWWQLVTQKKTDVRFMNLNVITVLVSLENWNKMSLVPKFTPLQEIHWVHSNAYKGSAYLFTFHKYLHFHWWYDVNNNTWKLRTIQQTILNNIHTYEVYCSAWSIKL